MENNEIIDRLPKHLHKVIIEQPYNNYTAQDHALWRYVMRQNVRYLSTVAHESYLEGLHKTGISTEHIPQMYGMNRILKEIGWAAVAVDGFIPPAIFMEFQANNVLVIAADIRPIEQIAYTPAPDIIHEAAGHAPIIADPVYADYLRKFGEAGSKAFSTPYDKKLYESIRHLSILKADPNSSPEEIGLAEKILEELNNMKVEPSELSLIRNLHWWTVEYGLIGDLKKPRIYGAGLLSSIAESHRCLKSIVKKIPYTIEAVNYSFDITLPQPQLFVTPDFDNLSFVLNAFTKTMAFRKGGLEGINKAIESEDTATLILSSGLQVSGLFVEVLEKNGQAVYFKTNGPTQLSFRNCEIPGHNKNYHNQGFGSPLGKLRKISRPIEDMLESDLDALGITIDKMAEFEFESGVKVKGILKEKTIRNGKVLLLSFAECNVTYNGKILFAPSWGNYDMATAEKIVSAHCGAADPESFGLEYASPKEKTHRIIFSEKDMKLHALYKQVREGRENKLSTSSLKEIWLNIKTNHHDDWLCALEILELVSARDNDLSGEIKDFLQQKAENEKYSKLIEDGLDILKK